MNINLTFEVANQRMNDLQRYTWRNRARRVYPDSERQPKRQHHWANR